MIEESELISKREKLKHQLTTGKYTTLVDVIFDKTGHIIQKLTRKSELPSFWLSSIVIGFVTLLIGLLAPLLLEFNNPIEHDLIQPIIISVGLGISQLIAAKLYVDILVLTLRDNLLDVVESPLDIANLQGWLDAICNIRIHLFFSLAYGFGLGLYTSILHSTAREGFIGFGPTILFLITTFQGGIFLYFFFLFLALPLRLNRYHFKLYETDPSSSTVLTVLSDMLTKFVYIAAVIAALITLNAAFSQLLTQTSIVLLITLGWGPITVFFVINQFALSKIITRAKGTKLNEIQARIEVLETEENIVDKETRDAIDWLLNYHDRIKSTRNSALDFRATLNFLNSLLLPLFAFVLGNLDTILGFLS